MGIDLQLPSLTELRPRLTVIGVGGAGGNAVNNMIESGLEGVEFIAANTDAQALLQSSAGCRIQMGVGLTEGLGAGSKPEIGAAAAEEAIEEIRAHLEGVHMLFITAGMGGGTGTGAAPVIARTAKELGILTVAVVTKPFEFEGQRRMRQAEAGIAALSKHVDTIIVIPNQNLFRIASEKTTFADAFLRADDVLRAGVSCITNLMIKEGLINLDFADVRAVMQNMGTALMGTGEAEGERRAYNAAQAAISNPLLGEVSMRGAKGLLVSITGSLDMTLFEVEEAASLIRREVDPESNPDINIIVGATFDNSLQSRMRVSVVATGIEGSADTLFMHQRQGGQGADAGRPRDARAAERQPAQNGAAETPRLLRAAKTQEQPQHWGGKQPPAEDGDGQGGKRVVLEPKQRRGGDYPAHADGQGQPFAPPPSSFEPIPPSKTVRPPRRPLTIQDFPELSAGVAAKSQHGRNEGRGFFDWIGRRNKSAQAGDSPLRDPQAVSFSPQPAYRKPRGEG